MLEHIDNPVMFLTKLRKNLIDNCEFDGRFIITVPNAYKMMRNSNYKKTEIINSDHRYWFTPYTIAKVCCLSGIMPEELLFVNYNRNDNSKNVIEKIIFKIYYLFTKKPLSVNSCFSDSLLIIGK